MYDLFDISFFICCPVNKMSHLLKLADEYQAQGVLDLCVEYLRQIPKWKENVVKILLLATHTVMAREDERLNSVRQQCKELIKNMDLADILGKSDFKNLDRDSLESVFVERTGRLETFLREVRPQLIGLLEYCIYLKLQSSSSDIFRCPQHFGTSSFKNKAKIGLLQRIRSCSVCVEMITQLVSSSIDSTKSHVYGGHCHFDTKIVSVIHGFERIISVPPTLPLTFTFDAAPSFSASGFAFLASTRSKV